MSTIWYYFSLGQYALHIVRILVQIHVHRFRDDGKLLILNEEVDVLEDVWVINAFVNHQLLETNAVFCIINVIIYYYLLHDKHILGCTVFLK